jgi:hypothetical protein
MARYDIAACAALAILGCVAATDAAASNLNQRNRLDDGSLGLPLDSLFKDRRPPQTYNPGGDSGEANLLPPIIDFAPPPSRSKAKEPEAPLGSALGGRRQD